MTRRIRKLLLKTFGPIVCHFRGHVTIEVTGYEEGRVINLVGCTRCLRSFGLREATPEKYPRPQAKVVVRR